VGLDAGDNDPQLLWNGLLAALVRSGSWPLQARLRRLRPPEDPVDPIFLAAVLTSLEAAEHPVVLVLGNAHVITRPQTLEILAHLVVWAPPQVRVVISTRMDPRLGSARLLVEGRLREITSRDLLFTVDDAHALLDGHVLDATQAERGALIQAAEGWAVGLRLASMWWHRTRRERSPVQDFAGHDPLVSHYLDTEVLATWSPDLRNSLIATSVCDHLDPDLAHALTGRSDAADLLDHFDRTHGLVVRVGVSPSSFRCHRLLRERLRADLRKTPDRERALHVVAATWLAKRQPSTGLRHAVEAGDDAVIADFIANSGPGLLLHGGPDLSVTLATWDPPRPIDPVIAAVITIATLEANDLERADAMLPELGAGGPGRGLAHGVVPVAVARVHYSLARGGVRQSAADLNEVMTGHGAGDDTQDLLATDALAAAFLYLGDVPMVERYAHQSLIAARRSGNYRMALKSLVRLRRRARAGTPIPGPP